MNVMRDNYSMGGSVSGSVRPPSIMLADVSPTPLRPPLNSISQMQEMNVAGNGNNIGMCVAGNHNGNIMPNNSSNSNSNMPSNNIGNGNNCNSSGNNNNNTNTGLGNPSGSSLRDSRMLPVGNRIGSRSVSQDSVYTILIRLPPDGASAANGGTGSSSGTGGAAGAAGIVASGGMGGSSSLADCTPSIKMIHEDVSSSSAGLGLGMGLGVGVGAGAGLVTAAPLPAPPATRRPLPSRDSEFSLPLGRRMSHAPHDVRLLNAKVIPKQLAGGKQAATAAGAAGQHALLNARNAAKKKKKSQEKRQESKAAKTLSAILLSFIITWTPYNILVLIKPLTTCSDCIPAELWDFFYALCYINSTINPMCYALCNASFRRTYIRILTCKWHTRNREGMVRGVYN